MGTATTNASGVATLSGVSVAVFGAGTYPGVVGASFAGDSAYAGSNGSGTLTINSTTSSLPTSLSNVSGSGKSGGSATVTATLTANGTPVVGRSVVFALTEGGATTAFGTATTNASGIATLTGVSLAGLVPGTYLSAARASPVTRPTDAALATAR